MSEVRERVDAILEDTPLVRALRELAAAVDEANANFAALARRVEDQDRRLNEMGVPQPKKQRQKKVRGVYCRWCNKRLEGKYQTIFDSRKCAAQWHKHHPGETPTPKMVEHEDDFAYGATVVAGEGVR